MNKFLNLSFLFPLIFSMSVNANNYDAYRTLAVPIIDGLASEVCWNTAQWEPIDQIWNGQSPIPSNCSARYKACWNGSKVFILMEVIDDVLVNWNPTEPLKNYPSNDCPEIFLDEDCSGGDHSTSHNAFAYHISTLYDIVDIDVDGAPKLFNDHIEVKRTNEGNTFLWEMAIDIYTENYVYGETNNEIVNLEVGKILGFSAAYNDSDHNFETRDAMLGSVRIEPWACSVLGYNDSGSNCSWQTASVFGTLSLKDTPLEFKNTTKFSAVNLTKTNDGIIVNGLKGQNLIKVKIYNSNGLLLKEHSILPNQVIPLSSAEISNIHIIVIDDGGVITKHKIQW